MSSFRPRKPYRFAPRVRRMSRPAAFSVRVRTCVRLSGDCTDAVALAHKVKGALAFALTSAVSIGLLALGSVARAQDPLAPYTHDVALHFLTDDLAHPNGGANGGKLASMWGPDMPGGFSYTYNLTTGWNANTTFGSFTDFKIPSIDLGLLGTIPALDLGEWGAGGQLFTKGQNTGLVFQALASAGGVSVDYPMHLQISTPKYVRAGFPVKVHVTYTGDAAAQVSTYSPQAAATMSFNADVQLYAKGRLELASFDLFNSEIIDACSRTDADSPKRGQGGGDKSLKANITLIDTNKLVNQGLSKATIKIGPDPASPEATIGFNLPIVNTVGQPGSYTNYPSGSGGTGSVGHGASYEYTTGIVTPDAVVKNPNATYARGQDTLITVTADFTNILTTQLEEAGIPVPPLNFSANLGKGVTINAGLLDFTGTLSLGFLQEFGFVPKPRVSLTIDGVGTTPEVEIDPINGNDITFTMPGNPNAANPDVPLSVRCTPHITLGNDFLSNTYFNLSGSLGLDPIILSTDSIDLGSGVRIPSFSFDPFPLSVGATVPIPLYKTTFEIPFAAQDGASFYIQTKTPPLANLIKLNPDLLYVNERDTINTGVSSLGTTLSTSSVPLPGNDFAAPWYGNIYPGTASQLHYYSSAYWDQVAESNHLLWDGPLTPGVVQYDSYAALFYNDGSNNGRRPDLSPGIHHVYGVNFVNTTSAPFGPQTSSLPISVAYPAPHIDDIGFISTTVPNTSAPLQDNTDPFRYSTYYHYEANQAVRGKALAGDAGFTIVAVDNTVFNPPNTTLDPNVGHLPFAEGSYSRIKLNGKLLAPDPAFKSFGRSWVTGIVPASMIATPGLKTIQITNPTTAGQGGDSNSLYLRVRSPKPAITDATVVQQGTVDQNNKVSVSLGAHQIVAGSPNTQISIAGSGLTADTYVYFNDTAQSNPLPTKFVSPTLMYATIPASVLTQPLRNPVLTLVNAGSGSSDFSDGGTASDTKLRVIANTPRITDVQAGGSSINALPLDAPTDTPLTIKGVHFWPALGVTFGKANLKTTFVDEQTLTALLPKSALSDQSVKPAQIALLAQGSDYDGDKQRSNPFGIQVLYAKPLLQGTNKLNAVLPAAMQAGTSAPTLTVTGGLFYPNSQVTLNAVPCGVQFVDSTHLSVTVPASVANTVGSYLLVVTNPTSNDTDGTPLNDGGPSNAVAFQVLKYAPQAQLSMTATVLPLFDNFVQAQITLTNTGVGDATGLATQYASLGAATNNSFILPNTLAVGQSVTLPVAFLIPSAAHGTIQTLKLAGTMNGATFSSTARVRVP